MNLPVKKRVVLQGVSLVVYSIGYLAALTFSKSRTIRSWESLGILPAPILQLGGKGDYRWYTAAELAGYSAIMLRHKRTHGSRGKLIPVRNALHNYRSTLVEVFESLTDGSRTNLPDNFRELPNDEELTKSLKNNLSRNFLNECKKLSRGAV